jgi:hypothetical protein
MSKDHVDSGVDLSITKFLGEWVVMTTLPLIHPRGHPPLMKQLNPMAEKGP